ncbi:MAG TPA: PstS family phosphate ABC transporter substrate-binding protein [Candidatus Prevotella avicola]|uniref:Phosphate-binding protein n=1 Tax=Candidatus Prevotella avicola TaxID=2838738 RepID=A0A9D2FY53_9BACT|nr:PstS family phosphate ABC transporter substrate-binding protein [Candidatus Prevotella avicola]
MKAKRLLLSAVAAILVSSVAAQKIKGSDTVLPVSQEAAEMYMSLHPDSRVTVTGGGSGVGISALMDGTTDIAMSSRSIKFNERVKLKNSGKQLKEAVVAYDALAVIVHPSNPVTHLTRQQLEAIFRGKVTNWNQVKDPYTGKRGPDLKIVVYSRETSSGTYEFFKTSVLREKNYMAGVLSMPATGAVIQSVSQTKGAIGYVGMAYVNDRVRAVKVSYDGKHFVYPTMETGRRHIYPIIRELYYYYTADRAKVVEPFLRFLLSSEGQRLVMRSGYVPVG